MKSRIHRGKRSLYSGEPHQEIGQIGLISKKLEHRIVSKILEEIKDVQLSPLPQEIHFRELSNLIDQGEFVAILKTAEEYLPGVRQYAQEEAGALYHLLASAYRNMHAPKPEIFDGYFLAKAAENCAKACQASPDNLKYRVDFASVLALQGKKQAVYAVSANILNHPNHPLHPKACPLSALAGSLT